MPAAEDARVLKLVMLAVFIWGTLLSLGALLFGIDQERGGIHFAPQPLRGAIVFACVLAFLGGWLLLLHNARRKAERPKGE